MPEKLTTYQTMGLIENQRLLSRFQHAIIMGFKIRLLPYLKFSEHGVFGNLEEGVDVGFPYAYCRGWLCWWNNLRKLFISHTGRMA